MTAFLKAGLRTVKTTVYWARKGNPCFLESWSSEQCSLWVEICLGKPKHFGAQLSVTHAALQPARSLSATTVSVLHSKRDNVSYLSPLYSNLCTFAALSGCHTFTWKLPCKVLYNISYANQANNSRSWRFPHRSLYSLSGT